VDLIKEILKAEKTLALRKVDSFNVSKRRRAARQAYVGTETLEHADRERLKSYLKYLQSKLVDRKYKSKGTPARRKEAAPEVAKLCSRCKHRCKQPGYVTVVQCPMFTPIAP